MNSLAKNWSGFQSRRPRFMLLMALAAGFSGGCGTTESPPEQAAPPAVAEGVVTERLDAGDYVFLCVNAGDQSYWLASVPTEVAVGDQIAYDKPLLMKDFRSASLQRTFPAILFVSGVRLVRPARRLVSRQETLPSGHPLIPAHSGAVESDRPAPPREGELGPPPGGLRIGDLFEQRARLDGTKVQVVGKVMKFNPGIMGWNWVHLQDGSGHDKAIDVTVTTQALVKVGDLVVAMGTLRADWTIEKGYYFPVLIEDAAIREMPLDRARH